MVIPTDELTSEWYLVKHTSKALWWSEFEILTNSLLCKVLLFLIHVNWAPGSANAEQVKFTVPPTNPTNFSTALVQRGLSVNI